MIQTHSERLSIPLKRKKPTVFSLWNDLFHETVPDSFVNASFAVMTGASRHTFLVLTKRMGRMADFVIGNKICENHYTKNIWFGLTVCNQEEAAAKIPEFLRVPGKKFLSLEPLLGPVDLRKLNTRPFPPYGFQSENALQHPCQIDAVILGGETGPGARPMHPDWVRSVRDQCASAGVPFFFKSGLGKRRCYFAEEMQDWGNYESVREYVEDGQGWPESVQMHRLLDGRTHDELAWT
jgi:protein gp37